MAGVASDRGGRRARGRRGESRRRRVGELVTAAEQVTVVCPPRPNLPVRLRALTKPLPFSLLFLVKFLPLFTLRFCPPVLKIKLLGEVMI